MTMSERRLLSSCGALAFSLAAGCAEPCLDDGLDQASPTNCSGADGGGTTDEPEPTTTTMLPVDETAEPSGCDNGIQDGDETDVDCGGSCADRCGGGQGCGSDDDCESNQCTPGMTCEAPSCTNLVLDGDETDVDCGGGTCPPCDNGETCEEGPDCESGMCDAGTCVGPSCSDGMTNGSETDVDCGGNSCPPCDNGEMCNEGSDCQSEMCDQGTCGGPSCTDGMLNADETDVDCGGPACPPCDDGEMCDEGPDCESTMCDQGTCVGPTCTDAMTNGTETDVDCGGPICPGCDDGEDCLVDDDCMSELCDPTSGTCLSHSCADGVFNGGETDLDCGGSCGATCESGEDCLVGGDCVSSLCDPGTLVCTDMLTVEAAPACSDYMGMPVPLTATASGGSGVYTYAWTPDDGSLSAPDQAMTTADPPTGFANYSVMVDDGFAMASDDALVVGPDALNLQNDCTVYVGDISMSAGPPTSMYDMGGTRQCETGNDDLIIHLCEGTSLHDVRLRGTVGVLDANGDGDIIGLVWGAQNSTNFYSLSWKADAQAIFTCNLPVGITVKRVEAALFTDIGGRDMFCPEDSGDSTFLLDPTSTTTEPWIEGESYDITIDFSAAGSTVTVERVSDGAMLANFVVPDTTFTSGYFGTLAFSQNDACAGPLLVECL